MKRMSLTLAAISALTIASCSDQGGAPPTPPPAEATSPYGGGSLNGRVVSVAYVEMSSRAVVFREAPDGALTACFWNTTPSQANPLGCVPLE